MNHSFLYFTDNLEYTNLVLLYSKLFHKVLLHYIIHDKLTRDKHIIKMTNKYMINM